MATTSETKARIKAVMGLTSTLTPPLVAEITPYENGKIAIPEASVPGWILYWPGTADYRYGSSSELIDDTKWVLLIVVQEYLDDQPDTKQAAYEACEPFLDSLPIFLARHRHLKLDGTDTGLAGTAPLTFRSEGIGDYPRAGKRYSSIAFRIDVTRNTDF